MRTLYLYRESGGVRRRYEVDVDDRMTVQSIRRSEDPKPPQVNLPISKDVIPFFAETSPCWFKGCEELREEYQRELGKLGKGCPECNRGPLMRKFAPRVEDAINNS